MPVDLTTAMPLQEAVQSLGKKTPLGSRMGSAEWALVAAEIRDRAFFSAQVEDERMLASMQARIARRLQLGTDGEGGVTMDRGRFIAEMQDELAAAGYRPDPEAAGTIQDLSSAGRLGLIWDMQLAMAQGYARWKSAMDPDLLDAAPAWELVRVEERVEKRDWPAVWESAGGQFAAEPGPDYPARGRMVALKTDGIWAAISRFGVPWPPFDWGSGMGLRNVRRKEAEALGLLGPDDSPAPLASPFNRGLEASTKGFSEAAKERLRSNFGDAVEIDEEKSTVRWVRPPDARPVEQEMRDRSRAAAEAGRAAGEDRDEVLAGMAALATGRRDVVQFAGEMVLDWLGDAVDSATSAGITWAWRKIRAQEAAAARAAGGIPGATVPVEIHRSNGDLAGTVMVPRKNAAVHAKARLRDFLLALGKGFRAVLHGEEVARG